MRAAYYGGAALTGSGQNLGLLEYLGTDLADLNTYYANVKQTNRVPITLLSTDGTSTHCVHSRSGGNCDDTEQTLDMTQALGMAPGTGQPGDVRWLNRYGDHQRNDDAQPASDYDRLLVGLDTGGSTTLDPI